MSVTSWKAAQVCSNDSSIGTFDWVTDNFFNPLDGDEVQASDAKYAGTPAGFGVTNSYYLKCEDFGFTSADIPSGSTIDGIEVEVVRYRQSTIAVATNLIKLVKGGTISGSDFGNTTDWSTSTETVNFGSVSELGGLSFSQSDIVASNFGVVIAFQSASYFGATAGRYWFIDRVRIRVNYTEPVASSRRRTGQIL